MEKRERVCSHSKKGEEVQGKRSESEGEADAELKAGGEAGFLFGQSCQAAGTGGETYRNCFLIKRGWARATNDRRLKYAGK